MSADVNVFWGEISPCDHCVQIYSDDDVFLDSLEGFVTSGLNAGEAVVIIATPAHREALEDRLRRVGVDWDAVRGEDRLIALDAEETLGQFMVRGWPEDSLFKKCISEILARARAGGRRVRAFGEMVAVLWAEGNNGATVRLEHLWNALCKHEGFPLFCAYPRAGFTRNMAASIQAICDAHSRVMGLANEVAHGAAVQSH